MEFITTAIAAYRYFSTNSIGKSTKFAQNRFRSKTKTKNSEPRKPIGPESSGLTNKNKSYLPFLREIQCSSQARQELVKHYWLIILSNCWKMLSPIWGLCHSAYWRCCMCYWWTNTALVIIDFLEFLPCHVSQVFYTTI